MDNFTKSAPKANRAASLCILLAEDSPINQKIARQVLEKLGHQVAVAATGVAVIKALTAQPYDLVLMDLQMPEMDGIETTRQIRDPQSMVRDHQIPIIAMTANVLQSALEQCRAAGMNGYLAKPFDPEKFTALITRQFPGLGRPPARPPIAAAGLEIFDRPAFLNRLDGDQELGREILALFMTETQGHLVNLRRAINQQDRGEMQRLVHKLKGAAANLGAGGLHDYASRFENPALAANTAAELKLLADLEEQFRLFRQYAAALAFNPGRSPRGQ